jgi:serine/threonine protein phosphatase PrpC
MTTMTLTVDAAARTHIGLVRKRNEDALYAGRSLFAVADGLGGHVAGDTASTTAIEVLQSIDRRVDPEYLPLVLGRAVSATNEALRRKIADAPELAGMATTLIAMLCSGDAAVLANVGDSRAYRLRHTGSVPNESPHLTQITEDHTYGHLVADAATVPGLPDRLYRFLDGRPDGRSPDLTRLNLHPGDRFLLCSDGLSAVVPHELITATLIARSDPNETADRLIALAIDHGGPDNIAVIVLNVRAPHAM